MPGQFDGRKVEPNSGLGTATYLLRRWNRFTLFLRRAMPQECRSASNEPF
jgi:hypothetical protein